MIFIEEARRSIIILLRYPLSILSTITVLTILFVGIYETSLSVGGQEGGHNAGSRQYVLRFVLWTVLIGGFSSISNGIANEARSGTLEAVFHSGRSVTLMYAMKATISVAISVCISLVILLVLSLFYDAWSDPSLHFPAALMITAATTIGFGLFFGGLTLVYKQLGPLTNVVQFVLLPAYFAGTFTPSNMLYFITPGYPAIKYMTQGDSRDLLLASVLAVAWLLAGCFFLSRSSKLTRSNGTLSQY